MVVTVVYAIGTAMVCVARLVGFLEEMRQVYRGGAALPKGTFPWSRWQSSS